MDTLQAILLGIVQGITEFLPVSSSGHLQIAKEVLGVQLEENLTFDVALHAATVLSTIVVLWSEVWRLLKGLFSRRFNEEQAYVLKLVLSMIPIGIVGFLLKDRINDLLNAPYILAVVGAMLIPAFSMLIKQGTACAVEGDIKVAMAMSILKTIADCGQLSEMYSIDFNEDICIIGHSGSGDADISTAKKPTMKIVPVFHGKTGGGYLTQFYPPVGDVTYLAITQDKDGHFKFVVAEGVNEPGPIFTFGDTNMRTRFSCGAREFVNRWSEAGPTHHMAAATGHHIDTILKVAEIFNVPVDVITR